jgi:hypothetical protein
MQQAALIDAPMSCACCRAVALQHFEAPSARRTNSGKPACELCGRQLGKVKHTHKHGPGHACHPRCKPREQTVEREAAPAAAAAAPVATRKRRATSDPGESPEPAATQAFAHRVIAPEPASTSKKQYNTRREGQIMRLLDETHARRIAAEEATAAASAAGERRATHAGFTLTFVQ